MDTHTMYFSILIENDEKTINKVIYNLTNKVKS